MGDQRDGGISWTDETWNCLRGCSRVSEGCRSCYAEVMAARFSGPGMPFEGLAKQTPSGPRWTGVVRLVPEKLDQPLRWKRPRRVFVNSVSDVFHENVSNETIAAIFGVMAAAPQHTFQILTKRPKRMREWFDWIEKALPSCHTLGAARGVRWFAWCEAGRASAEWESVVSPSWSGPMPAWRWPLPNVWLGVSVENQAAADERIPLLLETTAAVRFLSCEPLLGPVDIERVQWPKKHKVDVLRGGAWDAPGCPAGFVNHSDMNTIDWVIAGGESGHGARPMHIAWARSLRDQCAAAGVAYFHKQNGEWADVGGKEDFEDAGYRPETPSERWVNLAGGFGFHGDSVRLMQRVGKKAAGSLLDGVEHKNFPEVNHG